ncbi:MAG: hypothetical protein AB7O24_19225 [Kofleriaceae bacterium]
MTVDDDAAQLSTFAHQLQPIDLDTTTAERIARSARSQIGRRPPLRRLIEPALAMIVVVAYALWMFVKLREAFGL